METLFEKFHKKLATTSTDFTRSVMHEIAWHEARLIGIKGARGVGKTTLLFQYIKLHLTHKIGEVLYISLDNLYFNNNNLLALIDQFVKRGGNYLFIDEVHRYPNWSQELKNAYDDYPELRIVFTGSSMLEILNARADLSRRAVVYTMGGLSFREYLSIKNIHTFQPYTLNEILNNHQEYAIQISKEIRPLQWFQGYLEGGYYPYFIESESLYRTKVEEVVRMMLEIELPALRGLENQYIFKIKQLLMVLAESVPFTPNVSKLAERIGINRNTLIAYLKNLQDVGLTMHLFSQSAGITRLQKPEKIYLENTNLMYALNPNQVNTGNIRETFWMNQLSQLHNVTLPQQGDFLIDNQYTFEIGGKSKSSKQVKEINDAYIVKDDIEIGSNGVIPLWLFGFLY
jgi:predicted AAA+ superfamily ATPase